MRLLSVLLLLGTTLVCALPIRNPLKVSYEFSNQKQKYVAHTFPLGLVPGTAHSKFKSQIDKANSALWHENHQHERYTAPAIQENHLHYAPSHPLHYNPDLPNPTTANRQSNAAERAAKEKQFKDMKDYHLAKADRIQTGIAGGVKGPKPARPQSRYDDPPLGQGDLDHDELYRRRMGRGQSTGRPAEPRPGPAVVRPWEAHPMWQNMQVEDFSERRAASAA